MNCLIFAQGDRVSGNRIILSGRRLEHLRSVLKTKAGDRIVVGQLGGRLGGATVVSIDRAEAILDVELDREPPPALPVALIVALPRPKSMRKVIHAATAMGVKQIHFIGSWRVDKSFWQTPWLESDYLSELMVLGLEQAVDTMMPIVQCHRRFKPFVEDKLPPISKGSTAFVAHPKAEALCPRGIDYPVTLIVGPEGGFIPYEIELLEKHGAKPVTIGARILRVEEAVPAILGRLY